ncbi:MAG: methionine--tRNA ligase subunit beta [Nanoarchaeota archaeon]
MNEINLDDWKKIDIRVGKIKEAVNHPNADSLVILKVDLGKEVRQLVAGLKKHYNRQDLKGKNILVLTNLKPVEIRGVKSEGMLLAAVDKSSDKVVLLAPEKDVSSGTRVE